MTDPNWILRSVVYAVALGIGLLPLWMLLFVARSLGLSRPDRNILRTTFQLDEPECFRRFVPDWLFERREKQTYQFALVWVLGAAALYGFYANFPTLLGHRLERIAGFATVMMAWLFGMFRFGFSRFRPNLCDLGPNRLFDDRPHRFALHSHWIFRWPSLGIVLVGLIRIVVDPDDQLLNLNLAMLGMLAARGFWYSKTSQLLATGFSDVAALTPWRSVVAYHWYAHRQGVLFVRDAGPHYSPLVILPVPEDKADDVERILAEYLPDKRGEDVDFSAEEETPSEQTLTVSHS